MTVQNCCWVITGRQNTDNIINTNLKTPDNESNKTFRHGIVRIDTVLLL